MEAKMKKSVITWGSYLTVMGTFISVWVTGALDFVDAYGPFWGLTPLQVVFVPMVGIGAGLAIGEGISRVKAGSSFSEYVKAGTEEVEKFLQAGLGTDAGTAKRITGKWTSKAGEALGKLKTSITGSFNRLLRREGRNVNKIAASLDHDLFPAPQEMLAGFWRAMNNAFVPPQAKVRAASVLAGRAGEVTVYPIYEYDPTNVEAKEVYLKRRTKALVVLAVIVAAGFVTLAILKLFGVMP